MRRVCVCIYVIYWFLPFLFINSKVVLHQDWFYRYDEDAQKPLSASLYLSFPLHIYIHIHVFSAKPPSPPPYFVREATRDIQFGESITHRAAADTLRLCHKSTYSRNAFILFLLSWEREYASESHSSFYRSQLLSGVKERMWLLWQRYLWEAVSVKNWCKLRLYRWKGRGVFKRVFVVWPGLQVATGTSDLSCANVVKPCMQDWFPDTLIHLFFFWHKPGTHTHTQKESKSVCNPSLQPVFPARCQRQHVSFHLKQTSGGSKLQVHVWLSLSNWKRLIICKTSEHAAAG